jgi:tRNA G18 (ribose-2'-O)-methylase SpoU
MAEIIAIDDPDDPRVAAYRDVRERDLVGRKGLFVAEGEVVLNVLLGGRARHRPRSLLIAEKRFARLGDLLARVPAGVPVYAAAQPVIDSITGFHIHRGILAIGERAPMPSADALIAGLGRRALILVLSAIANHDNMGGVCRNAAAFGADAVILDGDCCDPFYRKAIRVSVGAALVLPFARVPSTDAALDLLSAHGFAVLALSPAGGVELGDVRRPDRVATLFGAEGPGLPQAVIDRAIGVRIAMAGGMDSLNVATASGIVLHHLAFGAASS